MSCIAGRGVLGDEHAAEGDAEIAREATGLADGGVEGAGEEVGCCGSVEDEEENVYGDEEGKGAGARPNGTCTGAERVKEEMMVVEGGSEMDSTTPESYGS